jgi:hypothetical protein
MPLYQSREDKDDCVLILGAFWEGNVVTGGIANVVCPINGQLRSQIALLTLEDMTELRDYLNKALPTT